MSKYKSGPGLILLLEELMMLSNSVRSEHEQAMKTQRQTKCQLESQSPQLCIPDPNPSGVVE